MRERVHGQIGIDLPAAGEQGADRAVRPQRRRAPGPRPVRPYVPQAAVRREGTPAPRPATPVAPGGRDSTSAAPRPAEPAAPPGGRDGTPRRSADPASTERDGAIALGAHRHAGARGAMDARGAAGRAALVAGTSSGAERGGVVPGGVVGGGAVGAVGGAVVPGGVVGGGAVGAVGGAVVPGVAGRGCGAVAGRRPVRPSAGPQLLVSRPGRPAPRRGERLRRLLAALALALVAAAVVVGLGRVADVAAESRAAEAPAATRVGEVTVTVTTPSTVWEVADRVAPGSSGPERTALVDRIVVANSLTSLRVEPGTVLRVPV